MLQYFTISGLFWAGALLLYFLFLQKRTFHTLNRMYLLFTLLLGSLIPFLELPIASTPVILGDFLQPIVIQLNGTIIENQPQQTEAVSTHTQWLLLLFVYASGVLFFIGKTLLGIFKIQKLIQKSKRQKNNTYVLLQNETSHSPFSFFNMIFIGTEDSENSAILQHELAHVKGKHSWDIILIQIIKAIHWFNPLLWIYERIIKQTHEYIADNYALQYTQKKDYSYMLLGQASPIFHVPITSTFHSFTKKRITMIFRKKSKVYSYIMYPIALLIVFRLSSFLLVSCQKPVSLTTPQIEDNIEYVTQIDTVVSFDPKTSVESIEIIKTEIKIDHNADSAPILNGGDNKVEYLTQIDTIYTFNPDTFVESVDIVKSEVEIYSQVDEKPSLKGCEEFSGEIRSTCSNAKLITTIMEMANFPENQNIEGQILIKFLINQNGYLSNPEVVKSLTPSYDKEALRVFRQLQDSTQWNPAKVNGKAVGFYYILPIQFKL